MSLTVSKVRVERISIERGSNGEISVTGHYCLVSEKGDIIAKLSFNGYNEMKFEFDKRITRDIIDEVESTIEIQIGIQDAIQTLTN